MSYQVLARKWRPKNFEQLVGQEHVVTVLVNALTQQRLHHAYLFTGTRGVGKTTIARIFAKSLNCEQGITATPCGTCDTCVDIDQGRFVDLLEIDAASRTKVDDTREILDNVQYAPTRGRYKVYLIDEVHMLSRSSFNALLKTLEEPPEHVKFILATTDPQKLPVTVLSRCLQFHLKALTVAQIETKLVHILKDEQVTHDAGTLTLLAKAARGSMRDSLSLTDQAIAQGQGALSVANIQQMLGGIDQNWPFKILINLVKQDAQALMILSQEIASYAPSYSRLLAELIQLLHQVALTQIVPQHFDLSPEHEVLLAKLCQALSPEDVQLYYQITLNGRKDLPYACDEQAAFDMVLLRLLAFKPMTLADAASKSVPTAQQPADVNFDEVKLAKTDITLNKETQEQAVHTEQAQPIAPAPIATAENNVTVIPSESSRGAITQLMTESITEPVNETLNHTEVVTSSTHTKIDDLADQLKAVEELAQQHGHMQSPAIDEANVDAALGEIEPAISPQENEATHHQQFAPPIEENTGSNAEQVAEPESIVEQAPASNYQSPIEAALATRNMLRSRKKQLEKDAKKSNGAHGRQENDAASHNLATNNTENSLANTEENKANIPDINTIPDQPFNPEVIDPSTIRKANQVDKWANMIDAMSLIARVRQLALHATIDESSTDNVLKLKLDQSIKHLNSDAAHKQLEANLSQYLSRPITVELEIVDKTVDDPYQIQTHINDKRLDYATDLIKSDPIVNQLIDHFQAQLDETSIIAR